MARIESRIGTSNYPTETIYQFISDFRNFREIVAGKLADFDASQDHCTFTIPSLGKGEMDIIEKELDKTIKIAGRGIQNTTFSLWIQTKKVTDTETKIKVTMEPDLNPMLMTLAKSHLQNFVNMLIDHMESFKFNQQ